MRPLISVSAVIFFLSLYALMIPELSALNTRIVATIINHPLPEEKKWPLTRGISRDFADLRSQLFSPIRNPHSRLLFVVFHASAAVSLLFLLIVWKRSIK